MTPFRTRSDMSTTKVRYGFCAHLLAALLLALNVGACDDAHDEHAHDDVDAEICEHMADGPARAVVAATEPGGEPPEIGAPHTRYDLALGDDGQGGFVGLVALPVGDDAVRIVAVDRGVEVSALDTAGAPLPLTSSEANPDCAGVTHHRFALPIGTATLRFASGEHDQVRVVIESDHAR